jgi:eukaryotic-like serine/threonine-protein kinase
VLGEVVSGWKVVQRLGKGGWGEVWRAQRGATSAAIKFLAADISANDTTVRRFFEEVTLTGRLAHPGIVQVFDTGFHAARAYVVMELLEGETLAARLRRFGRLPLANAIDLARQTASILATLHASGFVHRDVKPENLMLVADPDPTLPTRERVKLLDVGIARLGIAGSGISGGGLTAAGLLGTPAYMAPEQWNDATRADAHSDVYALGCVVFEVCCGRPPFIAASAGESCTKHLSEKPPHLRTLLPAASPELDDVLGQMLAKSPADRPSASDLVGAFDALALLLPAPSPVTIEATRQHRAAGTVGLDTTLRSAAAAVGSGAHPVRRARSRVLATIAGVFAIAGILAYIVLSRSDSDDARPAAPPVVVKPPPSPPPPALVHEALHVTPP